MADLDANGADVAGKDSDVGSGKRSIPTELLTVAPTEDPPTTGRDRTSDLLTDFPPLAPWASYFRGRDFFPHPNENPNKLSELVSFVSRRLNSAGIHDMPMETV
jgi:hypothetical protein